MYVYFSVLVGKLLLPLGRALLGEGGKSKNKSLKMIVLKQGNYSLRRPPKLIISAMFNEQSEYSKKLY